MSHREARIVIDGVQLSQGESMTVRVALEHFASELSENGLGDDPHGLKMTSLYLENIRRIRRYLYSNCQCP